MSKPAEIIGFILRQEGGYVNNRNDPGGETKYGISQRSYPDENIRELTPERASMIYLRDYWVPLHGDELPEPVALALMDYAVNSGVSRAVKALQGILEIKQDGIVGPRTLGRVQLNSDNRSPEQLAELLILNRALFLTELGCTRHGSENFLVGWMRRIRDNLRYIRRSEGW